MRLRDVEPGDVDAYVRMRCDPVMMAELGGPLPRDGIEAKVATDVRKTQADIYWVSMIVPDEAGPATTGAGVSFTPSPASPTSRPTPCAGRSDSSWSASAT